MRVELFMDVGGRHLLVEVDVPSPPFPREGHRIHRVSFVEDDDEYENFWPGLERTADALEIITKVEQRIRNLGRRYYPGVLRELLTLSRKAPHAGLRRLAEATADVVLHGRLDRRFEWDFRMVREGRPHRDTGKLQSCVTISRRSMAPTEWASATIGPTAVDLLLPGIHLNIWEETDGTGQVMIDEPDQGPSAGELPAGVRALVAWLATLPSFFGKGHGSFEGLVDDRRE